MKSENKEEIIDDIDAISVLEKVAMYYEYRDESNVHSLRIRDEIAILHNRVFGKDGEFNISQ